MKAGAWHQCGDKSQKLVAEQLEAGNGVGVILSPRDLSFSNAQNYAKKYAEMAEVVLDQQFHIPAFSNDKTKTYPVDEFRASISGLKDINDAALSKFASKLEITSRRLGVTAVMIYEAGRPEIIKLNERLFNASRIVGNAIGVPTFATVVIGKSAASTDKNADEILSSATSLDADGWYYAYEFDDDLGNDSGRNQFTRLGKRPYGFDSVVNFSTGEPTSGIKHLTTCRYRDKWRLVMIPSRNFAGISTISTIGRTFSLSGFCCIKRLSVVTHFTQERRHDQTWKMRAAHLLPPLAQQNLKVFPMDYVFS